MHQLPRRLPRSTTSRLAIPTTTPTAQQLDVQTDSEFDSSGSRPASLDNSRTSRSGHMAGVVAEDMMIGQTNAAVPSKDALSKLNQIVQNYHTKAALIILQSRFTFPPWIAKGTNEPKTNKWFNVEIDDTEALKEDFRIWKQSDALNHRPPPLYIDIYLDTAQLTHSESLVIVDDQGKRWDVLTSLNGAAAAASQRSERRSSRVILERWKIELGDARIPLPSDLGVILPTVYKKSIVLFRSLFMYCQLLPAWKFGKRLPKLRSNTPLKLNYSIYAAHNHHHPLSSESDGLYTPLYDGKDNGVESYLFHPTDSPAGELSISVTYRTNCDFRVDDSDELLSSHFIGMDEEFFKPSLPSNRAQRPPPQPLARESGSLPVERKGHRDLLEQATAYGSMSTFHNPAAPTSSSPLSALRAARNIVSQSPSDSNTQYKQSSHFRSSHGSKTSLKSLDDNPGPSRRPSVSFKPFKAPSLSASPSPVDAMPPPSPRGSLGRPSPLSALAEARSRPSHAASSPVIAQRSVPETGAASSTSTSPRPAPIQRYSSSFGHRRARPSTGGSKTEEDASSGRTSAASSAVQPSSSTLAETPVEYYADDDDDDNIAKFLKMIDSKRDLKSFRPSNAAAIEATARRTNTVLNKARHMRESNAALSESMMSSSMHLQRSSSSSSRQLSNVPAMIAGTSLSTSSSPGKPISPHTPHTPAIPSRLSANSVLCPSQRSTHEEDDRRSRRDVSTTSERTSRDSTVRDTSSNAIDIPTSPRSLQHPFRRSCSVAHRYRTGTGFDDDIGDLLPFGTRSASLGADERPALSLNALRDFQDNIDIPASFNDRSNQVSSVPASGSPESATEEKKREGSSSLESRASGAQIPSRPSTSFLSMPFRTRLNRGGARGAHSSAQGSISSLVGDGQSSERRVGRYSFTRATMNNAFEEDEPLLFAMSDFGQPKRSLEDTNERNSNGRDSGPSSRRGSRKGQPWS